MNVSWELNQFDDTGNLGRIHRRPEPANPSFAVVPLIGGCNVRFEPLWIEDVVTCLVNAPDANQLTGNAIPLGGSEYATFTEVIQTICQAMSVHRLLVPSPLTNDCPGYATVKTPVLSHPPLTSAALELFGSDNATDMGAVDRNFDFHRARSAITCALRADCVLADAAHLVWS